MELSSSVAVASICLPLSSILPSNENTATFSPDQGLDPNLDIELVTVVPEVTQRRVPDSPLSSEINQPLSTELGGLQTVRVQATVTGPSQLFDNLQLTSNPSRSELLPCLEVAYTRAGRQYTGTCQFCQLGCAWQLSGNHKQYWKCGLSELRLSPTVITSERAQLDTRFVSGSYH